MGQRHQLFIVARVLQAVGQPKTYRCVAAFHHQWCLGKLPLRSVNRFKHLARVKENAALIERDLRRYQEGLQQSSDTPCPYITFLAGSAFTTNIQRDDGLYFSNIYHESAEMGSMDGDNNDGITVIDVSIPQSPSYCFVSIDGLEAAEIEAPEECVPLTAEQYLRAYYPEVTDPPAIEEYRKAEARNLRAIRDLDDMPLLTLDVLAATWPHEYKVNGRAQTMSNPPVNSVTKLGLGLSNTGSLAPNRNSLVDFSKQDLTSTDLLRMLKDRAPFSRLDISHNKAVDKATLLQILKEHRLEWLNIDDCNISNADLADLLTHNASLFRGVEAVIHPAFLSLENLEGKGTSGIPNAFRFFYGDGKPFIGESGWISLPFFSVDQLVQNLTDIIEVHENSYFMERPSLSNLRSILASCYRKEGQSWATRAVQAIPPKSACGTLDEGYSFVFSARKGWLQFSENADLIDYQYGIVLPGKTKEYVDIKRFLQHLEDEGWPKPKNEDAVKRLVGKFDEETGPVLLKDVGAVMERISSRLMETTGN